MQQTTVACLDVTTELTAHYMPAEPLYKRVPVRDHEGRLLSDFMMLIPGLSRKTPQQIKNRLSAIQRVLSNYGKAVVFVDLNLRLNVLWVTVRPIPGICIELPAVIKQYVPEAVLVTHKLKE